MLILTRNVGQWIDIDGPCRICLSAIKSPTAAKIGIVAPRGVKILREELLDEVFDRHQAGEGT
jgi:carbon storage regulator CsrA